MRGRESEKDDVIRTMLQCGCSIRMIKATLHVSQARITKAQSTPFGTSTVMPKGPSPKVTPEIRALIEAETLADGTVHDAQLAEKVLNLTGVSLSHDLVRKVRHELGFNFRPRMSIQELSETQKKQR